MSTYQYSLLSTELIEALTADTGQGLNTVVLGPRFSGKHDLLRRVGWQLEQSGRRPVGPLRLLEPEPLTDAVELRCRLDAAVAKYLAAEEDGAPLKAENPDEVLPERDPDLLLASLDEVHRRLDRPLVLMLGNVDALSYALAQQLLQEIRVRTEARWLTVVLSGESELRRITEGPLSPFECERKIFVQGFDLALFRPVVQHYARAFGCEFEEPEAAAEALWKLTGGNTVLMRIVLWRLIEQNAPLLQVAPPPVTGPRVFTRQDLVLDAYNEDRIQLMFQGDAAFQGFDLVRAAPECWPFLEALLGGQKLLMDELSRSPSALEFAGILRRQNAQATLVPGILGKCARKYYTPQRFADMYAESGKWDEAFLRYKKLPPDQNKRPTSVEEHDRFQPILASLERELSRRAMDGTAPLRALLAQACTLLLGYDRATLWTVDRFATQPLVGTNVNSSISEKGDPADPTGATQEHREKVDEQRKWLLNGDQVDIQLLVSLPDRVLGIIRLPGLRSLQPSALVIEDLPKEPGRKEVAGAAPATPTMERNARCQMLQQLIERFGTIYQRALATERLSERQRVQRILSNSIDGILAVLGTPGQNIQTALPAADGALEELGYTRTLIALLNPRETQIECVYSRGFEQPDWLEARISYPVPSVLPSEAPTDELAPEPLVRAVQVRNGRAILIDDASTHSGCDGPVVEAYGIRAKAVIPLLNPRGKAVGAFHVERGDRGPLSEEEGQELVEFGRQLAVVLEQDHRAHLLKCALDMTQEPILVLSPAGLLRYCNETAATAIGLKKPPGWWWLDEAPTLPAADGQGEDRLLGAIIVAYRAALWSQYRQVRHLRQEKLGAARHDVIESRRIQNWRGLTSGVMVHVNHLLHVGMYIAALEEIAQAHTMAEAMTALLKVAQIFKHPFARLWVMAPEDPDVLHLTLLYSSLDEGPRSPSPDEPSLQNAREDPSRLRERFAFRDSKTPVVFVCREANDAAEGVKVTLERGLKAEIIHPHPRGTDWAKLAGQVWIDFSLWSADQCMGKLTLGAAETTSPEHLEMLAALAGFLSNWLTTLADNESLLEEKEKLIRSVEQSAERATATIAHGLNRHVASLDWIRFTYGRIGRAYPTLAPINAYFLEVLEDVDATLRRAKRLLRMVKASPGPTMLHPLLVKILKAVFPDKADWQLECDPNRRVPLDAELFKSAMAEVLDNSRYFTRPGTGVRVSVRVTFPRVADEKMFEIHICDNGPGIPAEHKETRIFEDFFTSRPEEELVDLQCPDPVDRPLRRNVKGEGTGLGLAHARRVIQAHHGEVFEVGFLGKGAHFVIVLPYYEFPGEVDA